MKSFWLFSLLLLLLSAIVLTACGGGSPETETEWYVDGTLHNATIAEWHEATYANRLATCADFIVSANQAEAERDFSTVKPKAIELEKCITENTVNRAEVQHQKVTESAAICVILLGYNQ